MFFFFIVCQRWTKVINVHPVCLSETFQATRQKNDAVTQKSPQGEYWAPSTEPSWIRMCCIWIILTVCMNDNEWWWVVAAAAERRTVEQDGWVEVQSTVRHNMKCRNGLCSHVQSKLAAELATPAEYLSFPLLPAQFSCSVMTRYRNRSPVWTSNRLNFPPLRPVPGGKM